ncbi:MAG TPA: hypothetical protein VFS05_05645 [Gemmatimonadaceae bacterium]|nr:hypothetical protein [Gemmatimonadaceae bacterium]
MEPFVVHEVLSYVVPGVVIIALGSPIVRLIAKRLEPRPVPPQSLAEIAERLRRIETAVDTIAVEVERVSEAQRYAAQLQAAQRPELPPPAAGARP